LALCRWTRQLLPSMVDVSYETAEETDERLRRVIRAAHLKVYEQPYAFAEFALDKFATAADPEALALVRDDETWSQLAPHRAGDAEPFTIFRFHFPSGVDNSGFVGWLATHLKRRLGTGVFVVCGQNSARGGIFDYWGCPVTLRDEVLAEIGSLVRSPSQGIKALPSQPQS
jgi:hypothetical protein